MKKYLFTGLVILLPVALTLMIIIFLFNFFTTPFVPIVTYFLSLLQESFTFSFPSWLDLFVTRLIALVLLCAFVFLLGIIAQAFLLRNLLSAANRLFLRIPFIKTVYKVSRDVFTAIFSQDGKKAFKRPVMIPFPDRPNYSIGFIAGEVPKECLIKSKKDLVSIFAPTAPHPISGFLFLVPKEDIYEIDMDNEDALKYLVSCGVIVPNEPKS